MLVTQHSAPTAAALRDCLCRGRGGTGAIILLIAAALLVRNNSISPGERARANEAAILQATLDTVRDGIAYFTSDGVLCAFNDKFFRLLDLPTSLARLQDTRLSMPGDRGLTAATDIGAAC